MSREVKSYLVRFVVILSCFVRIVRGPWISLAYVPPALRLFSHGGIGSYVLVCSLYESSFRFQFHIL